MTDPRAAELTAREMILGAFVGIMRSVEDMAKGYKPAYGAKANDWQISIEGTLGEMAAAKWLGVYWQGATVFRGCDLPGVEVRTRSRHHYELIVHPKDRDDAKFLLLTGAAGRYVVRGWILGKDAKREEWWNDPA